MCLVLESIRFIISLVPVDRNSLPKDPEILQQMLVDLTAQLDKTQRLLRQLLAAKSGTRSEQLSADQLRLFAQELGVPSSQQSKRRQTTTTILAAGSEQWRYRIKPPAWTPAAALASEAGTHRARSDGRRKALRCCSQDLRPIGEETSERYEYIPAQLLVIEEVCKKYACACTVKTATKPPQPIEKSTAGASLLAQVIVSKIADHVPVHRQAKILRRFGVEIPDQTMCGWMRQSAELLDPLYVRLKQFVLSSKVVGTDDTPVKVLDRKLGANDAQGTILAVSGRPETSGGGVRLHADPGTRRTREIPQRLSRVSAGRCLCGLRQLFYQSGTREWWRWPAGRTPDGIFIRRSIPIRRAWARCWPTSRSSMRWRNERASRHRGRGVGSITRAGVAAGARTVARVFVEDSRRGVAEERSWTSGGVHTEELGRADALLQGRRPIHR